MRADVDRVVEVVAAGAGSAPSGTSLAATRRALEHPLGVAGTAWHSARILVATAPRGESQGLSDLRAAARFACTAFGDDAEQWLPPFQGSIPVANSQGAIFAMDFLLNEPRLKFAAALNDRPDPEELCAFLLGIRQYPTLGQQGHDRWGSLATRASRAIDLSDPGMMRAIAHSLAHIDADLGITADWSASEPEPPREEIARALTGTILACEFVEGVGWVVVGSLADNTYDMSQVAAVFDPGGNDKYEWHKLRTGNQAVIDLAGNDLYSGKAIQGPAAGIYGLSLIDDRAGDDIYDGNSFACGVGIMGVGVLIDRAGNDRYSGGDWSIGTGAFGAGFVFDHAGADTYEAGAYSQGCGGPLGLGAIVDRKGNDLYRMRELVPSGYGDPAINYAMAQGVGVGIRYLVAGGLGAICDMAGDDRFEGGEFSQGCGYFHGVGMIFDAAGDDLHCSGRYSQGTAAHHGVGAMIDLCGNDTYWSMVAASQGGAWDLSAALLLDGSGDDTYRAGGLSQGAASQQAIGYLCDLDGSDHYLGLGSSVQGESGGNGYHFDQLHARSFSLLIDRGAGVDYFSSMRPAGSITATGPIGTGAPAGAPLFGLFIDAP